MTSVATAWMDEAACLGCDDLLNIPTGERRLEEAVRAKQICAGCHVQPECLAWTLSFDDLPSDMVQAGYTPEELKELRRS